MDGRHVDSRMLQKTSGWPTRRQQNAAEDEWMAARLSEAARVGKVLHQYQVNVLKDGEWHIVGDS